MKTVLFSGRRVLTLLKKDLVHGSKSFFFILAILVPVITSLLVSLVFGDLFADKPQLGILDKGNSVITAAFLEKEFLDVALYENQDQLMADVEAGRLDCGYVFPSDMDRQIREGREIAFKAYKWGQISAKNLSVIYSTAVGLFFDAAEREIPMEIVPTVVGAEESKPFHIIMLPYLVLIAVMLGGILIPGSSLVSEKMAGTDQALTTTPVLLREILVSKGIMGVVISMVMASMILLFNNAFGSNPGLLFTLLGLSAVFASSLGLLLGTLAKDMGGLITLIKSLVVFLYAPTVLEMLDQVPSWISRLFPTFYIFNPVMEVGLKGAGWGDLAGQVSILAGLALAMAGTVVIVSSRQAKKV